jgi:hyperosmotically inducible protein
MRQRLLRPAALGMIVAVATLTGCGDDRNDNANANRPANTNVRNTNVANTNTAAARDDDDYTTPDGIITAKTELALMADADASAFDVDVDTAQGVVTLSGKVETDKSKAAAERVAKGIEGVKSVNNQLQVVPEARQEAVEDSDDNVRKAVNDLLDNDATIKDLDLRGEVNAGVVTLNGELANYGELMRAANAVRKVKGVKRVVTSAVKLEDGRGAPATAPANTNAAKK